MAALVRDFASPYNDTFTFFILFDKTVEGGDRLEIPFRCIGWMTGVDSFQRLFCTVQPIIAWRALLLGESCILDLAAGEPARLYVGSLS